MNREIFALRRRDDETFLFYEDGEITEEWLAEDYTEAWGVLIVKVLRHLRNIADKRLKTL